MEPALVKVLILILRALAMILHKAVCGYAVEEDTARDLIHDINLEAIYLKNNHT